MGFITGLDFLASFRYTRSYSKRRKCGERWSFGYAQEKVHTDILNRGGQGVKSPVKEL
jgi:hypothetical protein